MKNNIQYYCFNEKGETHLPEKDKINELYENGTRPVVFIDSCVCLHIVKLIDYGKKATGINIKRLHSLKEYISNNNMKLQPLLGLIELSQNNGKVDNDKFWDFYKRIDFFNLMPVKNLKNFRYDFYQNYFLNEESRIDEYENSYLGLDMYFLNTYASLLKIRSLSLGKSSKKYAESNILEFISWMRDELGVILGVEYRLAMNVFGGMTEFRKMIWLDGKKEVLRKKLIGTAWDITHSRLCSNNVLISKTLQENISAYFVTSDFNLYNLLSSYSITMILDNKNLGATTLYNTDFKLPHLDKSFIDKNNKMMLDMAYDRLNQKIIFDIKRVLKIIVELEKINNVAQQGI